MFFVLLSLLAADPAPLLSAGGTDALLAGLVGSLGGGGFSVWYGFHVTTKSIPKIVADHQKERQLDREERLSFQVSLKELTAAISQLPCLKIPICRSET